MAKQQSEDERMACEIAKHTGINGFNAIAHGFAVENGIVCRPNGKPVCLCPSCNLPATVIRVHGIHRQHKCLGYQDGPQNAILGCGMAFWSIAWKRSSQPR